MPKTRFYVVRHGQTEWNEVGRLQGHSNSPLSALGLDQVQRVAQRFEGLDIDALYSSDLGRALQSAEPIARVLQRAIHKESRLRERSLGIFEGLTRSEAAERFPDVYPRHRSDDAEFTIPHGQSVSAHAAQVLQALKEIAERHVDKNVALVTHGGPLSVLFRTCVQLPLATARCFGLPNAALNIFDYKAGKLKLVCWGDRAHLDDPTEDTDPANP
jgi:probable phosphoglycerate mutase